MTHDDRPIEELLNYWGVRSETHSGIMRVFVPPIPHIRDLPGAYRWIAALAAMVVLYSLLAAAPFLRGHPAEAAGFLPGLGIWGCAVLGMLAMARHRLRRQLVIEVDDTTLRVLKIQSGRQTLVGEYSTRQSADVRINRSNGKLLIPIAGTDAAEIFLTPCTPVNYWIAQTLARRISAGSQPDAADRQLWYAGDYLTPARPSSNTRRIMFGASMAVAAIGVAVLFTPVAPLGFYILLLSAVPVGIAMGTQKKDYWV